MAGEFFGSINPELESMFHNIINNDINDISNYERDPNAKQVDFFTKVEPKMGHTVRFTNMKSDIEDFNDFFDNVSAYSAHNYTKASLNGYIDDVNTIAHEFGHRFALPKGAGFGFGECPSIYTELLLYDYYRENNIISDEELFQLKKLKFTPYLYKIAVPTIIRKNVLNLIENNASIDQEVLQAYIDDLPEGSSDKYAMEFGMKNPVVLDLGKQQGFEYIEGVLLASHLKNNNISYDELLTKMAHCVSDEDTRQFFSGEYGIDIDVIDENLVISDSVVDSLVKSFQKEVEKDAHQKDILKEAIKETEETTTIEQIEDNQSQIAKVIDEKQIEDKNIAK